MTGRLNWEKANKREKSSPAPEQFQPVKTDAAFWRAWKDDPDAMRPPLTCPPPKNIATLRCWLRRCHRAGLGAVP
jgi:hypothetical protein